MPTLTIDNRTVRLSDQLQLLLSEGATSAKFSVGYLFWDGLLPLQELLSNLDSIEILIGNVDNRLAEEQIEEATASLHRGGEELVMQQDDVASSLRDRHDRAAVETAMNLRNTLAGLSRTDDMRLLLLQFARQIADGKLRVRLFTGGRIHAKVSLIGYGSKESNESVRNCVAVVGSSNPTMAFAGHITDMNVLVSDRHAVAELNSWYSTIWNASQDFHRNLFDELGRSWALF